MSLPLITGVVVHWRDEEGLARLVEAWPRDERFELLVVDNGSLSELPRGPYRRLEGVGNLGFGGGANLGVNEAKAPWVLILNSDVVATADALTSLLEAPRSHPDAVGFAPRMVGLDGSPQWRWQLRRLPRAIDLLLQAFFIDVSLSPEREPAAGTAIEQPAAAALLLDRRVLLELGGFDEAFYPAWFEDVDLARRLRDSGAVLRYWPSAELRHVQGATVPQLGYGHFLRIYYRNLHRYLGKHHGATAALLLRLLLPPGMLARVVTLPLRRPRRAASRLAAARGLVRVAADAVTGWRAFSPGRREP